MDTLLIVMLGLLAALAVIDLFVGVSNDAVNFLSSAVGVRTASFAVIMAVAGAGVLLGATFSSGMMTVAKTGILVPEFFSFRDVLVIFTAVMVCDVLLLNIFNALGLPTSTTVSIVFELLGGAAALAFSKVWSSGEPLAHIGQYLNSGKALAMIIAILVSVAVAFVSGLVVQFLLRLVFSFDYRRYYRLLGGLFGGLALTAVFYFLIIKGAKGASFMTPEALAWIGSNTGLLLATAFAGFTVLMQAGILLFNLNVFRVVILAGTFSLAFAFAGNDLVNFIGVPLAAIESAQLFSAAPGADPDTFMMAGLRNNAPAPTLWLLASGLVMVLTLFFSKQARRVIQTSLSLSSSSRGDKEQFGASAPARLTVRCALRADRLMREFLPVSVLDAIDARFTKPELKAGEPVLPFDEIRACVNLVLAAALIASATSLKLPLSTTYVTFMVAMGSSLADGAWNRESAVYRISGVLTVISGWFVTALSAFALCLAVTLCFRAAGDPLMIAGMVGALFLVIRSNFFTKDKTAEAATQAARIERGDRDSIRELLAVGIPEVRTEMLTLFAGSLEGLLKGDRRALRSLKGDAAVLFDRVSQERSRYYRMALGNRDTPARADRDARNFYYRAYTAMKETGHALRDQTGVTENYIANCHSPYTGELARSLSALADSLRQLSGSYTPDASQRLIMLIEAAQREFPAQMAADRLSLRKSELYLGYLLFTRELLNRFAMLELLQKELTHTDRKA